jgi:hypothetical protein
MIHDWVYGWAMVMTLVAVGSLFVAVGMIRNRAGRFTDVEQMVKRNPWSPPSPIAQRVTVAYVKSEPLALPRGDR